MQIFLTQVVQMVQPIQPLIAVYHATYNGSTP